MQIRKSSKYNIRPQISDLKLYQFFDFKIKDKIQIYLKLSNS